MATVEQNIQQYTAEIDKKDAKIEELEERLLATTDPALEAKLQKQIDEARTARDKLINMRKDLQLAAAAAAQPGVAPAGRSIRGDISGGLAARPFKTQRPHTAKGLLSLVDEAGALLVRGPPQTGKTSLLELVEAEALSSSDWRHVIRISMASGTTLDAVMQNQANTTWADFWGSPRPSTDDGSSSPGRATFLRHVKRLLLVDEAQLLFPPGVADEFWKNVKALLDGGKTLPNVGVVMFAMLGDQPSGLPATAGPSPTPPQFSGGSRIEMWKSASQDLMLALDLEEYSELWAAYEAHYNFRDFFMDAGLRTYLHQVTGGHVGLITAVMDLAADKLMHRVPTQNEAGLGDGILKYMFQGDLYSRLVGQRCLMSPTRMDRYKFFLDKLLRAGDDGMMPEGGVEQDLAEQLRLQGMVHVAAAGRASFITPLHRHFYMVWIYTLPGMCDAAVATVVNNNAEFERFLLLTISRMRAWELRHSISVGHDGRVYERHYQVEWYRAARSYLPRTISIAPDVGQFFGTSGRVDFWIQFPGPATTPGWAIELLRDGDRAGEHLARFAQGGAYYNMPFSQSAVIDFRSPHKTAGARLPGMSYVFFETNFSHAVVCFPGREPQRVALVDEVQHQ